MIYFLKTMLLILLPDCGSSLFKHFAINDFTSWDSSLWGTKMPATVYRREDSKQLPLILVFHHGISFLRKVVDFSTCKYFLSLIFLILISLCSSLLVVLPFKSFLLLSAVNALSVRYRSHVCSMSMLRGSSLHSESLADFAHVKVYIH